MAFGTLSMKGKQPERLPDDDSYKLDVFGDHLRISVVNKEGTVTSSITLSEFNVWSLIGTLSLFVGLKLPANVARRIRL